MGQTLLTSAQHALLPLSKLVKPDRGGEVHPNDKFDDEDRPTVLTEEPTSSRHRNRSQAEITSAPQVAASYLSREEAGPRSTTSTARSTY